MASNGTYIDELNTGLPSTFRIIDGKFEMAGGDAKADDNLMMLMSFMGWFRFTLPNFVLRLLFLYQRNSSYVVKYKGVYRLELLKAIERYCPTVEVRAVDFPQEFGDRKSLGVLMQYRYRLSKRTEFKTIKFVKAL